MGGLLWETPLGTTIGGLSLVDTLVGSLLGDNWEGTLWNSLMGHP